MNTKVLNILEHMLDDALDAVKFAHEIENPDAFATNRLYRKAVVMSCQFQFETWRRIF